MDHPDSIRAVLGLRERKSLQAALAKHTSGIVDVGQNFEQRARISKAGQLPTLIKNTGVLVAFHYGPRTACPCGALEVEVPTSCGMCYRGRRPIRADAPLLTCQLHQVQCCPQCYDVYHSETLFTARDCLVMMGFPITAEQRSACATHSTINSVFSDNSDKPSK